MVLSSEGFTIYATKELTFKCFFAHSSVTEVEFSNDEKYILSFNGTKAQCEDFENYKIWNVLEQYQIRSFTAEH